MTLSIEKQEFFEELWQNCSADIAQARNRGVGRDSELNVLRRLVIHVRGAIQSLHRWIDERDTDVGKLSGHYKRLWACHRLLQDTYTDKLRDGCTRSNVTEFRGRPIANFVTFLKDLGQHHISAIGKQSLKPTHSPLLNIKKSDWGFYLMCNDQTESLFAEDAVDAVVTECDHLLHSMLPGTAHEAISASGLSVGQRPTSPDRAECEDLNRIAWDVYEAVWRVRRNMHPTEPLSRERSEAFVAMIEPLRVQLSASLKQHRLTLEEALFRRNMIPAFDDVACNSFHDYVLTWGHRVRARVGQIRAVWNWRDERKFSPDEKLAAAQRYTNELREMLTTIQPENVVLSSLRLEQYTLKAAYEGVAQIDPPSESQVNQSPELEASVAIQSLPLRYRSAYKAYLLAECGLEKRGVKDDSAYDWLERQDLSNSGDVDLVDYQLPILSTWKKYLRDARSELGTSKYTKRADRRLGRSIVLQSEI